MGLEAVLKALSQYCIPASHSLTPKDVHFLLSNEAIDPSKSTTFYTKEMPLIIRPKVSAQFEEVMQIKASPGIAVVVGDAHLLHILPELQARGIDTVFQFDLDEAVLSSAQQRQQALLKAKSFDEFKEFIIGHFNIAHEFLGKEMPSYSIFCSEERFRACQAALQATTVIQLKMNVLSEQFWELLHENRLSVAYLNVSNLFDYWCGRLLVAADMYRAHYDQQAILQLYKLLYQGRLLETTAIQYSLCLTELYTDVHCTEKANVLPVARTTVRGLKEALDAEHDMPLFIERLYLTLVHDMVLNIAKESSIADQLTLFDALDYTKLLQKIAQGNYRAINEKERSFLKVPGDRQKVLYGYRVASASLAPLMPHSTGKTENRISTNRFYP